VVFGESLLSAYLLIIRILSILLMEERACSKVCDNFVLCCPQFPSPYSSFINSHRRRLVSIRNTKLSCNLFNSLEFHQFCHIVMGMI
jgi:hypothetical protein